MDTTNAEEEIAVKRLRDTDLWIKIKVPRSVKFLILKWLRLFSIAQPLITKLLFHLATFWVLNINLIDESTINVATKALFMGNAYLWKGLHVLFMR